MYNNEVTYSERWETPENNNALKKLENKYFSRSECSPSCPESWAPEVLELFTQLDKELGIRYNESTLGGYYVKGTWFSWFVTGPWLDMLAVVKNTINPPNYWNKSIPARIIKFPSKLISAFMGSFTYGFRSFGPKYVNKYLNRIFNKRITLGQLKEKHGRLTVYFSCNDAFEEYVEQAVRRCEIKLALKGAYTPVENFYNAATSYNIGTKHRPDTLTIKKTNEDGSIYVSFTKYRKVMQELGVDLEEVAKKNNGEES